MTVLQKQCAVRAINRAAAVSDHRIPSLFRDLIAFNQDERVGGIAASLMNHTCKRGFFRAEFTIDYNRSCRTAEQRKHLTDRREIIAAGKEEIDIFSDCVRILNNDGCVQSRGATGDENLKTVVFCAALCVRSGIDIKKRIVDQFQAMRFFLYRECGYQAG